MLGMLTGDVGMIEASERGAAWMDADDGWRALHERLVEVARRRRVLEAEETELLVEAEDSRLFRRLGYVSMHEYMERELGYSRHAANERLRTARELLELPKLREAYRAGELSFTAVRELTRVVTPATEEAFVAAAEGKTAGEVQQLIAGRGKGDLPTTPPDPRLARRRVVLDLSAEEHAMWMRMRTVVADEMGHHIEDGVLVRMLSSMVEEEGAMPHDDGRAGHHEVKDTLGREVEDTADGDSENMARGEDEHTADEDFEDMAGDEVGHTADGEVRHADVDPVSHAATGVGGHAGTGGVGHAGTGGVGHAGAGIAGHARTAVVSHAGTGGVGHAGTGVIDGTRVAVAAPAKRRPPRPSLLHAVSTCSRCLTTVAVTAGTEAPLTEAERSRIDCDSLQIGDVSQDGGHVQYAIPAATRMKVFVRDKFRCAVPGCRSRRCLQVHHLRPRSVGGTNELSNLILLCAGHHQLHHEGKLLIEGRAPEVQITWANEIEPLAAFVPAPPRARASEARAGM